MKIRLDYGRAGLSVTIPDDLHVSILEPAKGTPLTNPTAALKEAFKHPIGTRPLAELAHGRRDAVVVISDKTRPVPYSLVLPPILHQLERAGIARQHIEILVATGLHRANTFDELVEMTTPDIVAQYRIRSHVARDADAHAHLGTTQRGTEIWVDKGFLAADLKIATGLIEPHLMAGYSGGRKAVVPGLAGVDTMRSAHGPTMLEGEVGPGILTGNPLHEDLLEIVRRVRVDFLVDVSIDRQRRLTGVFAGDIEQAHAAGTAAVEQMVRVDLDRAADVVIVSAAGHPLDATFYQAVKGLTAALNIVRRGGTIILAAECDEGIGSVEFRKLLGNLRTHDDFMAQITAPGFFEIDQWMAQHLCQVLRKAQVILVSERLPANALPAVVTRAPTVEAALRGAVAKLTEPAHIAVIPEGPYVLGTVRGRKQSLGQAWREEAA